MSDSDEWRRAHLTETYKSLITLSVEALKMLALVNGGAAVALLTYLGNLVSHDSSGRVPLPRLTFSLEAYCGGLLLTVLAFVAAYLSQNRLYNEERDLYYGRSVRRRHQWGVRLGGALAILSAAAFGLGSLAAARVLLGGSG
jgi:hypothetical protein